MSGRSREDPMARWPYSDNDLRTMYTGGRGNATARTLKEGGK
jgi:hypothetical protein